VAASTSITNTVTISATALHHYQALNYAMLTDLLLKVHAESKGTYGIQRVHAELTLERGAQVSHNQVELLMRRAGLRGVTGRRKRKWKWKWVLSDTIATDLVERNFTRNGPNQL